MSRKKNKYKALIVCKNNSAVRCYEGSSCEKCGWNPKIEKERRENRTKKEVVNRGR